MCASLVKKEVRNSKVAEGGKIESEKPLWTRKRRKEPRSSIRKIVPSPKGGGGEGTVVKDNGSQTFRRGRAFRPRSAIKKEIFQKELRQLKI